MNRSVKLFFQFFRRDAHIHFKRIKYYIVNYGLIFPCMYSLCFGYIQPNLYFETGNTAFATLLYSGTILLPLIVLGYSLTFQLLFDLEHVQFINYQITILNPRLVLLERVIFYAIFLFLIVMPFFPISKLLLQHNLETPNISWPRLAIILFASSLCSVAYHQLAACILKSSRSISQFWSRWNSQLLIFGGFFFPWKTLTQFSTIFGYILLANPFIYMTEGIRQSIIGGPQFLSFSICLIGLLSFTIIFYVASWHFFKKRTDHI